MRLWSIHPRSLDARGLVALWREGLLARKVLRGRTRGYRHHPQLQRFRDLRDPVAAIEKSWFMTRGHGWRIFGMYLLSILLFIGGFVLILVGSIFALMWSSTAFASLYHAVDLEDQARLNQNGVALNEVPA